MTIRNWTVKDIVFKTNEREKTAKFVASLVCRGWDLHDGEIKEGLAFGEEQDDPGFEAIQLIK